MPQQPVQSGKRQILLAALLCTAITAASAYWLRSHTDAAHERQLRFSLEVLRASLQQFHADTGRYPAALNELVAARYLRQLPKDPFNDRHDAWVLTRENGGIVDVASSAAGSDRHGVPYRRW